MRNRAKCKLCGDIIESYHNYDHVSCKCGEIAVSAGSQMVCMANDWSNFLRVDDEGNEIIVTVKEKEQSQDTQQLEIPTSKPNKAEMIDLLKMQLSSIESLPPNAMSTYITHYDWASLLILLIALFEAKD